MGTLVAGDLSNEDLKVTCDAADDKKAESAHKWIIDVAAHPDKAKSARTKITNLGDDNALPAALNSRLALAGVKDMTVSKVLNGDLAFTVTPFPMCEGNL